MSDIKPIGFMADNGIGGVPSLHFGEIPKFVALAHSTSLLYDQSAIDRLTAERDDALAAADSKAGWEWKKRAEKAEAERDAAVADANRFRFISRLKCNHFHIGYNDGHKVNYTSLKEWIDESDDLYSDVDSETRRMMVESDSDWSIQIYPDTPIGFNVYRASTLADVIDAAMKEQEQVK